MKTRKKEAANAGLVGFLVNLILFILKFVSGTLFNSVSLVSDAFNNLSDFLSSIITIVGFKVSQKPANKDYPFGYERFEYISGFMISIVMLYIGFETFKKGLSAILNPTTLLIEPIMIIVLIVSMGLKVYLFYYYKFKNKRIGSDVLKAVAQDSLIDVLISVSILLGFMLSQLLNINLDGYLGMLVSLFIIVSSLWMIRGFITDLLGKRPSESKIQIITDILDKQSKLVGYHDLLMHEYGDDTTYGSVHVEVDDRLSLIEAHKIVDEIEREISKTSGYALIVHIDPVDISTRQIKEIHQLLKQTLKSLDPQLTFHDLRLEDNVLGFDVVVSENCLFKDEKILDILEITFEDYTLDVVFDHHSLIQ